MKNLFAVVRQVQEVKTFKSKTGGEDFKKQIIIVESLEKNTPYPIEFENANIELLKDILLGHEVKIKHYIKGKYDPNDRTKVYSSFIGTEITIV